MAKEKDVLIIDSSKNTEVTANNKESKTNKSKSANNSARDSTCKKVSNNSDTSVSSKTPKEEVEIGKLNSTSSPSKINKNNKQIKANNVDKNVTPSSEKITSSNETKENVVEKLFNKDNLEKVLDKYSNRLIGFINSYVCDVYVSEDIMMDIFVDLLKNKPDIESEQAFSSYLFVCARNKSLNYIKKNKRLTILSEDILADTYELENLLYDSHSKKLLFQTLQKLKPNYRTVLYLSFFEDMKIEEIEKIMTKSNKQVRNLKHRAIKKMNELLKQQNFFYKEVQDEN